MNTLKQLRLFLFLALIMSLSLACDASTIFNSVSSVSAPPPADIGTPTGSSPMSGDWGAPTNFGKLSFRVDPDGKMIETMYIEMHNWTCGGDTLTTQLQARTDPPADVTDDSFQMAVNLGDAGEHFNELYVLGVYDKVHNKFTGKWEQDAYGTKCTGTWQTAARK